MKQCKDDNVPFDQLALIWQKVEASNAASSAAVQQQQIQVQPAQQLQQISALQQQQQQQPSPEGMNLQVNVPVSAEQLAMELPPGQAQNLINGNLASPAQSQEQQIRQQQQPDFQVMSESSLMNPIQKENKKTFEKVNFENFFTVFSTVFYQMKYNLKFYHNQDLNQL